MWDTPRPFVHKRFATMSIICMLCLCISVPNGCDRSSPPPDRLEISETELPTITAGSSANIIISVANLGSSDIKVNQWTTSCGCVQVVKASPFIAHNTSSTISLHYAGQPRGGMSNIGLRLSYSVAGTLHDHVFPIKIRTRDAPMEVIPASYDFGNKLVVPSCAKGFQVKNLTNHDWVLSDSPNDGPLRVPPMGQATLYASAYPDVVPGPIDRVYELKFRDTQDPSHTCAAYLSLKGSFQVPPLICDSSLTSELDLDGATPSVRCAVKRSFLQRVRVSRPFVIDRIVDVEEGTLILLRLGEPVEHGQQLVSALELFTSEADRRYLRVSINTRVISNAIVVYDGDRDYINDNGVLRPIVSSGDWLPAWFTRDFSAPFQMIVAPADVLAAQPSCSPDAWEIEVLHRLGVERIVLSPHGRT